MRQMLNVLYVTTEDAYLSLNGECVEIHVSEAPSKKYPPKDYKDVLDTAHLASSTPRCTG